MLEDCEVLPEEVAIMLKALEVKNMNLTWNVGKNESNITLSMKWTVIQEKENISRKYKSPSIRRYELERRKKFKERKKLKKRTGELPKRCYQQRYR